MTRLGRVVVALSGLLACLSFEAAYAWGPVANLSVVTTAVRVLSQDGSIPLLKLDRYVREGARISASDQARLHPLFAIDPIATIERELYLLQSVGGGRVDPYYAYRLGALGKLVSTVTAPMRGGPSAYRDGYNRDADRRIGSAEIHLSQRKIVDPQTYFTIVQRSASAQDDTIIKDYESGLGFQGLAGAALSIDVSRSVDAVTDVWYTIFTSRVSYVNVSRVNMREYLLAGLDFYLKRSKLAEGDEMYDRIHSLGLVNDDTRATIGDLFFDSGLHERAMGEYTSVLDHNPRRRDVMEKIARYYSTVGEEALDEGRLEVALNSFASAVAADKLYPDAQRRLQTIQALIMERDSRLSRSRDAIMVAHDLESRAESEAMNRNYAEAISLFREATARYQSVPDEFAAESNSANVSLRNVTLRIRELKGELIENSQTLSGSGFAHDAQALAERIRDVDEDALRALLDAEFRDVVEGLRAQSRDSIQSFP